MTDFLDARWENIVMANYSVPVSLLQPFLPAGVEIDLYKGDAYVSLVGFLFKDSSLFKIPIPKFGTFEEVNLRFYVKRKDGDEIKRGVVFINETVPYKLVAWLANKLYKEHYTAVKTRHNLNVDFVTRQVKYEWSINKKWNSIYVEATKKSVPMNEDSFEEFIFEHYYGYTKINELRTQEYKIDHPRWNIYEVIQANINCDFEANYGKGFSFLNSKTPTSIFMAEGSAIKVKWKRKDL